MTGVLSRWLGPFRRSVRPSGTLLPGPIRGELLGAEHLAERARAVALGQRLEPGRRGPRRALLLARLNDTRRILVASYERLVAAAARGAELDPAGEWLLDNFHVVQEHLREVHESLPRDYYHELPALAGGTLAGYPRVYELVITLISHTEARIDPENVDLFVAAFQESATLSIGELWAMPAMLRLGLIESVRRMTLRTVERLDQVEEADRWVQRLLQESEAGSADLSQSFEEFVRGPHVRSPVFVSRFLQQFRSVAGAAPPLLWLERWLAEEGLAPELADTRATERIALTTLTMANSITSLRGIAQRDWRAFVEGQSVMEQVLRQDPSEFYGRMTFGTRDAYRHVVERIVKRTARSEAEVAGHAIELARAGAAGGDSRRAHVGFYLVDRGRAELEAQCGYRPGPGEALYRWVLAHPDPVFFGSLTVTTAMVLLAIVWLGGPDARAAWLAVTLLLLLPAADIAVSLVNQLVTILLPPRVLPKLDFREGVPEQYRTAVVVPILLDSVAGAEEALANLEVQFLANRDPHLHFALLSDFKDSETETQPSDGGILAAAEAGVRSLNSRYAPEQGSLFYLFHRPRRWNERQRVWMGWERKRGKLAEFNHFLRGGAADAFSLIVGDTEPLRRVRYVITLDADTLLPPEAAPALAGTLAHPLNRASYDAARRRVVQGYGILQPRVEVSLASAHRSRFAAIHSGHPGVDPYTTAVSDVYQDLYGEGSYTGKGIYEVDAFERATHGRFPENALLSHDLIEGSFARAGLASDITVYDDYPTSYLTFSRRKHRWIRGDWQLLPWLLPQVPVSAGWERNPLPLLARWKLLDNLRRSTVELSQLALLFAGWTLLPGSPLQWTLLGLGAIGAPWLVALLIAALRPPRDKSWRAYYSAVGQDARISGQQLALAILFLPHQAWLSADAIIRSLWRLLVTRRGLLEWETASRTERVSAGTPEEVGRAMGPAVAATSLFAMALLALELAGRGGGHPWALAATLLPLALLWAIAPVIAWAISVPRSRAPQPLSPASRDLALRYARLHWEYFNRFVTTETNWLAPDNVQEDSAPKVTLRTSPTNLGLQLLATVSAYDLELLGLDDLALRLERAFDSLGRLPRFRGHFYNWYGLSDLDVLEPGYISTVDSGNFAGHLLALRQALVDIAEAVRARHSETATRLEAVAEQAQRYALEMDFRLLYDPAHKLFSIGYSTATHSLDDSYYDLLASEARLASFVAIAKNDVPVGHWFRLGRGLIHAGGDTALVSWSGSMFEYLMPLLVLHSFPSTVLGRSYHGALGRQIAYGAERGVPWGMSECAYNVRDRHGTYQYRGFGVPGLALKRGLGRDLVIAPYATALAAMLEPERALANLRELEQLGLLGGCGFYDSADYTRPEPGRPYAVVRTQMAHHIGMTLVSLTNTLLAHRWQQRFHRDPMVRATTLLLDEQVPRRLTLTQPTSRLEEVPPALEPARPVVREVETPDTSQPRVALLGHAPYTVMLSQSGSGYSRYEELAVTRWRADGTRDNTGQFCYLKDLGRGRLWSAAHQPLCARADWYRAYLATDRVTLHRADGDFETRTEIVVVPEDAAEVRQVTVTNNGDQTGEVELTSYGEIVLAPPDRDRAHPAFANLFVETEWHEWCSAITATRRPRSAAEPRLWCVHVVDHGAERVGPVSCETDRARFLGRGRTTRNPLALETDGALSGTTGAVLDPIFALRTRVRLAPGQSASVAFTTLVATTRERAFELADRYHDPRAAQRALELAWTATQLELQGLELTPDAAAAAQDLAGHLFYRNPTLAASRDELRRDGGSRQQLWANGISGDWPVLLATIESAEGLSTLRQVLSAHRYCRRHGMMVDLVVVNGQRLSYQQDLNDRITESLLAAGGSALLDAPGGVFLRQRDRLAPDDLRMLAATARVRILCDGRSLVQVLSEARPQEVPGLEEPPLLLRRAEAPAAFSSSLVRRLARHAAGVIRAGVEPFTPSRSVSPEPQPDSGPLQFDNGFGGLTPEGAYRIRVQGDQVPPAPWANVIANPQGGFVVTERGGGFSWAGNSYLFRLTPWHNDPVSDPVGEALYLGDEESGEFWSATPAPLGRESAYLVEHGAGYSTFEHQSGGIASQLTLGLAPDQAVKLSLLRLTNRTTRTRRITLTAYTEWTLGVMREHTQHQVSTRFDAERGAIFARNLFEPEFARWVAFCGLSEPVAAHTGDRREFIGRNGSLADPAGLRREPLSGMTGAGLDPCAVLRSALTLAPGETREVVVLLGAAPDELQALRAVERYRNLSQAQNAVATTVREWEKRLRVIQVRTPDPAFDSMLNRWSLYQALVCRIWGRSGVYQSSGAYGFRDQLQDVLALVYAEPGLARAHLVRAAGRQFLEGDVQHWWHPESGRGVRTRFSDDLAWLPYAADFYVRVTGDTSVLDELVPFLTMRPLEPEEVEVYDLPLTSGEHASVYEHCLRALRKASTEGPHGLPLIGSGDWNDGMNRVGARGTGESVWLGWFLATTLRGFAGRAEARGDDGTGAELRRRADEYIAAIEAHGWDGAWYRRAYFDDGTPLGSADNAECRIDSIAQSWSVISGAGAPERQATALGSLEEQLVVEPARILLLLTPPFDRMPQDPGYIKGYVPGVRENGGQYTHAALWAVLAVALRGDGDRAFELFQMVNPLTHAATPEGVATYKVEPYVVAADVYAAASSLGRGGWTWYTGSASWLYRVGLEAILGFTKRGATLQIDPRVPTDWPEFAIEYRYGRSDYRIVVQAPGALRQAGALVTLDGRVLDGDRIPLVDDGRPHAVLVRPRG